MTNEVKLQHVSSTWIRRTFTHKISSLGKHSMPVSLNLSLQSIYGFIIVINPSPSILYCNLIFLIRCRRGVTTAIVFIFSHGTSVKENRAPSLWRSWSSRSLRSWPSYVVRRRDLGFARVSSGSIFAILESCFTFLRVRHISQAIGTS